MARMSPADRRAAIVAATLTVIRSQGIASTTVRDVASQMGSSSGLIHHYFASMDDLLAAAFDEAASADFDETLEAISNGVDAVEQLAWFLATYTRAEGDWSMQLWLDAWAEAARRPALQRTSARLNEAWHEQLAAVIRRGVHSGQMTCTDPVATAWQVLSLLDGLALQTVAHPTTITRAQADTWSRELIEREVGLAHGSLRIDTSVGSVGRVG